MKIPHFAAALLATLLALAGPAGATDTGPFAICTKGSVVMTDEPAAYYPNGAGRAGTSAITWQDSNLWDDWVWKGSNVGQLFFCPTGSQSCMFLWSQAKAVTDTLTFGATATPGLSIAPKSLTAAFNVQYAVAVQVTETYGQNVTVAAGTWVEPIVVQRRSPNTSGTTTGAWHNLQGTDLNTSWQGKFACADWQAGYVTTWTTQNMAVGNFYRSYHVWTDAIRVEAESYTVMSGVATESCNEGGQNVGWIDANDWMVYNVSLPVAGAYKVEYRVASLNGGGKIQLEQAGGGFVYGSLAVPSTGGWQNWTTISHTVQLNAGVQQIAIKALAGGWNINWLQFTKL